MNKRNFLKYLLSTFSILNLSQLDAKNSTLIQRKIPKDQKKDLPPRNLSEKIATNILVNME